MKWAENLTELTASLSLYSSTSIPEAMGLATSDAQRFVESKALSDWRGGKEAESKVQTAVVDRLNSVIRAIGALAKSLSQRRF